MTALSAISDASLFDIGFCFVQLSENIDASIAEKVHADYRLYDNARHLFIDSLQLQSPLCRYSIDSPVVISAKVSEPSSLNESSFLGNLSHLCSSVDYMISLHDWFAKVAPNDRVVVCFENRSEQARLAVAVLAMLPHGMNDGNVQLICECLLSDDMPSDWQYMRLGELNGMAALFATGLHNLAHKRSVTLFQTVSALLVSINVSVSGVGILSDEGGLKVSLHNFANISLTDSLCCLSLLSSLCKQKDRLQHFYRRIGLSLSESERMDDNLLSTFFNFVMSFDDILPLMDASVYVEMPCDCLDKAVDMLNRSDRLSGFSSNQIRRKVFIKSLVSAAVKHRPTVTETTSPQKNTTMPPFESRMLYSSEVCNESVSSSFYWDMTNSAFRQSDWPLHEALLVRSTVLDLWQYFYKPGLNSLSVSEMLISRSLNRQQLSLFNSTSTGRLLSDIDVLYSLSYGSSLIACSSPLTGFALLSLVGIDKSKARELGCRDKDFMKFIYVYVHMFENRFSPDFMSYVDYQVADFVTEFQGVLPNIIANYPRFRSHVPLSFND